MKRGVTCFGISTNKLPEREAVSVRLHVHQELGFGTFTIGLVTGSRFAASLLARVVGPHL